jgi:hypothetical protein
MNTVFICTMNEDEQLKPLYQELMEGKKKSNQQRDFLLKQVENITKELNEEKKQTWDKIKKVLQEKNKLPSVYNDEQYSLRYEPDNSQLFMEKEECDHGQIEALLNMLTKK